MPEISRFYGIIIRMFHSEHNPPHFHVEYGKYNAAISISTGGLMSGELPPRIFGMVAEWTALHRRELLEDWNKAENQKPLDKIAPL